MARRRAATVRRLEQATGRLASAAIQRMDETLPWYRAMPPEERSWVGLVAQAGIAAFLNWFRDPEGSQAITADVFGTAPRELTRAVSLQQTVELVRVTIAVVEEAVDELAAPGEEQLLRESVLRYSREIAFAAAQVYAQAAEARGAWDARLEALVVDALLRADVDEAVRSRASALHWGQRGNIAVVIGQAKDASPDDVAETVHRSARHAGLDVISAVQGDRLVIAMDGVEEAEKAAKALLAPFAPHAPVVVGPIVRQLIEAPVSAAEAVAGLRAVAAWPAAPRPVLAGQLLPERALNGDPVARDMLRVQVHEHLLEAGGELMATVSAYLEESGSIEGAARALFVHPNTVRYRLRRVSEVTGFVPTNARGAFTLRVGLAVGRLGVLEVSYKST